MDRQVAISLIAELKETTSTPFFYFFMRDLLVKYKEHPRINVLNCISNAYNNKHVHLDVTLVSDAVFQIRDNDEILSEFMNFFHFQYMDTRRMLSETQDMLAITQGMLSTTREMLTDLNVVLARIV
jgi:hypothetical protein